MTQRALITGGAGFIGSHLADRLLARGFDVRILDNLTEQVHGPERRAPRYLDERVELQVGDVRDADAVQAALKGVDVVFHLAAAVGVGQSMYEVARYTAINNLGTAVLLEALSKRPVERLVVASSMSLYGEGRYRTAHGVNVDEVDRDLADLRAGRFEPRIDGEALEPIPTPEGKMPSLSSVYALSKYDQERLCLMMGRAYGIPTVALRFFNAYGPRQALSNPYTGVLAIFGSRLLNDRPPLIFEDGQQQRDFVSVHDVTRACCSAMEARHAKGEVFNIGSGAATTIRRVAERMAETLGKPSLGPQVTHRYRMGDVRHCFADIGHAQEVLGYRPSVSLDEGMHELCDWLATQTAEDRVEQARRELDRRGLTV